MDSWLIEILKDIKSGRHRFSDHAVKRMIKRNIERHEIEEAVSNGEVIEKYPDDKYFPSCLVMVGPRMAGFCTRRFPCLRPWW